MSSAFYLTKTKNCSCFQKLKKEKSFGCNTSGIMKWISNFRDVFCIFSGYLICLYIWISFWRLKSKVWCIWTSLFSYFISYLSYASFWRWNSKNANGMQSELFQMSYTHHNNGWYAWRCGRIGRGSYSDTIFLGKEKCVKCRGLWRSGGTCSP